MTNYSLNFSSIPTSASLLQAFFEDFLTETSDFLVGMFLVVHRSFVTDDHYFAKSPEDCMIEMVYIDPHIDDPNQTVVGNNCSKVMVTILYVHCKALFDPISFLK